MTGASSLISRLRAAGISISSQDGKLLVEAPKGAVTAAIRAELGENKVELIAALAVTPALSDEDSRVGAARREIARLLAAAYRRSQKVHPNGLSVTRISGNSELANSRTVSVHGGVS
ncbi:MAG TPA: hypothetical protein VN841_23950 [Bryobacteraceae bacterium]|nr:hypothetical protein [Bryobacteraceae bacterium]